MRDDQTRSEWLHYTGECILGPFAGRSLPVVDSTMLTWRGFRELHPGATIIEHTGALWRRIAGRLFGGRTPRIMGLPGLFRRTMRPVDQRLANGEFGLGIVIGRRSLVGGVKEAGARFYPFKALCAADIVNDCVAETPLVVAFDPAAGNAVAFLSTWEDGSVLTFERAASGGLRDTKTGAEFDLAGRKLAEGSTGERLKPAPALATRWYGFSQSYPNTSIWSPGNEAAGV